MPLALLLSRSISVTQLIENLFDPSSLQLLAGGEELARLDAVARLLRRRRHQLVLHLGQPELELLQRSELDLLVEECVIVELSVIFCMVVRLKTWWRTRTLWNRIKPFVLP